MKQKRHGLWWIACRWVISFKSVQIGPNRGYCTPHSARLVSKSVSSKFGFRSDLVICKSFIHLVTKQESEKYRFMVLTRATDWIGNTETDSWLETMKQESDNHSYKSDNRDTITVRVREIDSQKQEWGNHNDKNNNRETIRVREQLQQEQQQRDNKRRVRVRANNVHDVMVMELR